MTGAATQVVIPEIAPHETSRSLSLIDIANDYVIDSPEVRKFADADLATAKKQRKHLEGMRVDIKAPILEAGRKIDALFKPMLDACDKAIGTYTEKLLDFDRTVATARAEEQRAAEAAAAATRQKLEAQATALAAAGSADAAVAVKEAAALVQAPVIPLGPEKSETSTNKAVTWSGEVVDFDALIKAVADGTVPHEALLPNDVYLNGRARLEKSALAIPGVKAVGKEGLRARRAA